MPEVTKWLNEATILRAVVGSTAHGLHVGDGIEDRDEMGVCIEPLEVALAFTPFEQHIFRSAAVREGRHDARSRAGDLDLTVFSLRKFLRLALKGNPSILLLLFVSGPLIRDARGAQLQELASKIVNRKAGAAFLGYMTAQRQRWMGERGQKDVNRPELVEAFGFDTKYAMHVCRLGLQGVELMTTGRLTLPMAQEHQDWLRALRTGGISEQDALTRAGQLEHELRDAYDTSPLQKAPDREAVEAWMIETYFQTWKARQPLASLAWQREDGTRYVCPR